jgi:hypothetical protein
VIRVVLTVLVAVALLTASMPAVETARATTTADRLGAEADELERAIGDLAAGSTAVDDPAMAARATVPVRAPSGFTAAAVERVALVEPPDRPGAIAIAYRVDGRPRRVVRVGTGPAPVQVDLVDAPIDLRPSGVSRVRVRYVDDGGPTIRIDRVG